nr:Chain P, Analogue of RT-RH pol protease substrate peptide [synthetic construct]
GAEVFYVDGA